MQCVGNEKGNKIFARPAARPAPPRLAFLAWPSAPAAPTASKGLTWL